jgi:hypothetical protein
MQATFATTALENDAEIEEAQYAIGACGYFDNQAV